MDAKPKKSRPIRWLLLGLALAVLLLAALRLQRGYEALLLLADLTGQEIPDLLEIRPAAFRRTVAIEQAGHHYLADIYQSREPPRAGLLLLHGAVPEGREHLQLRAFATTLARSGFVVLTPDLPSLRGLRLTPETIHEVEDLFRHLLKLQNGNRAGMAAISVAVGPAMIAALRPELAGDVDFLLAVGGYYDLPRLLGYHATGHYQVAETRLEQRPNEFAKWSFLLSHLHHLKSPEDRERLQAIARRRLENPSDPAMDLVEGLGVEARQVFEFITNEEPTERSRLMAMLPTAIHIDITALDLANKDLEGFTGKAILVHGLDDRVIPAAESQALARALPPGHAHLAIVGGLEHITTRPDTLEIWRLWQAADALLAAARR